MTTQTQYSPQSGFGGVVETKWGSYRVDLSDELRNAQKWIDSQVGQEIIPFCTNPMMRTGIVYFCKIINGQAIACFSSEWWAMTYGDKKPCDLNLGNVVAIQRDGTLTATIGIRNVNGIVYLKYGKG